MRRLIYTTNAIEGFNRQLRKAVSYTHLDVYKRQALYDALAPYLTTDMSRGRLVNTLWSAREYARTTPLAPEGVREIGSDGFMEFHADDDALKAMVLELFYTRVE